MIVAERFVCFILRCLLSLFLFIQNSQLIVSGASSATGNSVRPFITRTHPGSQRLVHVFIDDLQKT